MKLTGQWFFVIVCLTSWASIGNAITYDIVLDESQSVPAPTLNGTDPSGSATVDVNTITGEIGVSGTYADMTSDVVAAHLHGLAAPGSTAGVIFGFDVSGGTSGTFNGNSTLTTDHLKGLLAGNTYINVHTTNNGPGEIRGQVVDPDIRVFELNLGPEQSSPPPVLGGATPSGTATVVVDTSNGEIEVSGSYAGMTSDVVAAHLHGLAPLGSNAGVIFGFDVTGGTEGTFSGTSTLTADNLAGLLSGQTYINVHTQNNGPGEIRSQVVPEPTGLALILIGMTSLLRRRRSTR